MYQINVVVDLPLRKCYSYLHSEPLNPGTRVEVEFNGRRQVAVVHSSIRFDSTLGTEIKTPKLKQILAVSPDALNLSPIIWQLCLFAANYYHHPLGETVFCALPSLLRKLNPALPKLEETIYYQANPKLQPRLRGDKQHQLWQALVAQTLTLSACKQLVGTGAKPLIQRWLAANYIQPGAAPSPATSQAPLPLNPEQALVVSKFSQQLEQFQVGLLYGITGSGKTEVYLHLIAQVLERGQQVLVLIPEINLTPQLASRFQQRFPYAQISLLNSEISDQQRLKAWLNAANGHSQIILGTRLSVFTPLAQLGLIIVDEEHDESFKQSDGLRYHARDLAVWRAKLQQVPILLASATPSLETLYNYHLGKYQLYKLSQRAVATARLPQIELINLQHNPVNDAGLSAQALAAIHNCIQQQQLALIYINRRGYAPILTCYDCGWVSSCRYCSTRLVYHQHSSHLKCHHCGDQQLLPSKCPQCHNQYLQTLGHGTQKLEEFLRQFFPSAKICRIDRDTTTTKQNWNQIYTAVANQQIDIIVGTQMLAKGHDFPRLTLVVGLNLDNALFSYDFRASEDMFNLLTQVAGRAGRAEHPGKVILQTNYPSHPVYQFLLQHDFNGFINHCLQERKHNHLPPFNHYCMLKLSSQREDKLKQVTSELYRYASNLQLAQITIFKPVAAVLYKLHNRFRSQILISSHNRQALHNYLTKLEAELPSNKHGVSIIFDVDPFEV